MYFDVEIQGNVESGSALPLYVELPKYLSPNMALIGSFSVKRDNQVRFFIDQTAWVGLLKDAGYPFYFNPMRDRAGVITHGYLSDAKVDSYSIECRITRRNSNG